MHTEDKMARLQAPDGSRYEGEFKEGLRHGKGEISYTCADKFAGEWRAGGAREGGTNLILRKPLRLCSVRSLSVCLFVVLLLACLPPCSLCAPACRLPAALPASDVGTQEMTLSCAPNLPRESTITSTSTSTSPSTIFVTVTNNITTVPGACLARARPGMC